MAEMPGRAGSTLLGLRSSATSSYHSKTKPKTQPDIQLARQHNTLHSVYLLGSHLSLQNGRQLLLNNMNHTWPH